ncbi:SET domain protein 38 isoform 1 [Hibiscus syriacus]|uniref:Fatty acyl-CoA reductase n=1 Tax=Hibiscus syriacus TaxID=106335 RepID=A0A6A3CAK7_HIBSY|nr:SET domain protein 38 isoform 1 [Hibiscus syriacus]
MGALFLNCFSVSPNKLFNKRHSLNHSTTTTDCNLAHCRGESSAVRQTSRIVKGADCGAAVMDAGSLIMSPNPNPNTQADIAVKDLVPYGGTTGLVEFQEGIGIVKFLRGKEFFITGSTGFLAKVLIEKILRAVPDVGNIFVLVKAKSKEEAMDRLKTEEMFVNLILDWMLMFLIRLRNIVNHAANTTFDERYDVAMDINTRGHMLMAKDKSYGKGISHGRLHCKGKFDFGNHTEIGTRVRYRGRVRIGLRYQGRARKHGWQDTYVFTKAMGEMMINNMRSEIQVVIIRPSVIENTCREPFPGWMEGNRMMDPIVLCYGKGQLTGFLIDPIGVLVVVPADMVVNANLAAIARHGMTPKPDINIYHIASSAVNPLVFQDLARMLHDHYNSWPFHDSKAPRSTTGFTASWSGKLSQKLEAVCRKLVEQAKYLANINERYTFYGGRFDNSNTMRLMEKMSEEEKMSFGFDVESIEWKDYIKNEHIPGLRRHVMKGRGMCSSPIT